MHGLGEIKSINAYRVELHRKEQADKLGKAEKAKRVAASHAKAKSSAKYV